MINVAFWANVALTLSIILLVMVEIWKAYRAGRKNQTIIKQSKKTYAIIVSATPLNNEVSARRIDKKQQIQWNRKGAYYFL
jgi:hypothetical protein